MYTCHVLLERVFPRRRFDGPGADWPEPVAVMQTSGALREAASILG